MEVLSFTDARARRGLTVAIDPAAHALRDLDLAITDVMDAINTATSREQLFDLYRELGPLFDRLACVQSMALDRVPYLKD